MIFLMRTIKRTVHNTVIHMVCIKIKEIIMKSWTKPAATEMRFGFEVTMYVMNK